MNVNVRVNKVPFQVFTVSFGLFAQVCYCDFHLMTIQRQSVFGFVVFVDKMHFGTIGLDTIGRAIIFTPKSQRQTSITGYGLLVK